MNVDVDGFRDWLEAYRENASIPSLSVGVVADGEPVLLDGFGSPSLDESLSTTADTTYPAGSLMAPLAATTVLGMYVDGHVELTDRVSDLSYWEGFAGALADAGSVFGGDTDDGTVVEPVDADVPVTVEDVLSNRVNGDPGGEFLYNPVVFGRLADYLEARTGTGYRQWLERYVLAPARMTDTAAGWRDESRGSVVSRLADPCRHDDEGQLEPSSMPEATLSTSTGLLTTVRDVAAFDQALDADLLVDEATRERMWTPADGPDGDAPYGMGWFVQDHAGERLVWHSGWWPEAYAALYLKAPDAGYSLVALSNTDALWWDNPLDEARVQDCAVARAFLDRFVR